jgi:hypothetical protein
MKTLPQASAPGGSFQYASLQKIRQFAPLLQSGFPAASVLDDFNRANGGIGNNWSGYTLSFSISSNQLAVNASGNETGVYWNSVSFGADQEAYFTFAQMYENTSEQSPWRSKRRAMVQLRSRWSTMRMRTRCG